MQPRSSLLYVAATAILLLAEGVHAQPSDSDNAEAAQLIYAKAQKEAAAGNVAQASRDFEAAKKLLPGHVRTRISLAECYVKLGRPATALNELSEARTMITDIEKDKAKIIEIDKMIAEVTPVIPTLTISVPQDISTLAGLTITRNGSEVPRNLWGQPIPLDYGAQTIEATALGKPSWSTRVDIDNSSKQFTATIAPNWTSPPKIINDGRQTQTQLPAPRDTWQTQPVRPWNQPISGYGPVEPPVEPRPVAPPSKQRYLGIAGMAVGGAALGVGFFVGQSAIELNAESNDGHCRSDDHCDQIGYDLRTDARLYGNVSTGLVIAGGALLVGGIILFATSKRASAPTQSISPQITRIDLRLGSGQIGFGGVF